MALNQVAGNRDCDDVVNCPKVFDQQERILFQGYEATGAERAELHLGPGETGLWIPRDVALELARHLKDEL